MDERDRVERDYWERRAEAWDQRVGMLERFTEDFGHAAMDTLGPVVGARVLDVGCGPGSTTLDLGARVLPAGAVVGLDISPAMVAAGQRRAASAGIDHVDFLVHDLQEGPLSEPFDVVFSRFGVMFFTRPEVAFANLVRSLVPGGRFACVVWAPIDRNPWMSLPTMVGAGALDAELMLPAPGAPGPFSLSDPAVLVGLLDGAGLVDVEVAECTGRLEIPRAQARAEIASMLEIGPLGDAVAAADTTTKEAAISAVLAAIETFRVGAGWELPGAALVVSARRPS
jgi:SAM-dependent methyltransferase